MINELQKYTNLGCSLVLCKNKNPNINGPDYQLKTTTHKDGLPIIINKDTPIPLIEETIKKRNANGYGILLQYSSYIILDFDVKKPGGAESLEECKQFLPPTYTVKTPSGGYHYYYHIRDKRHITRWTDGRWYSAVDILTEGFLVCPGSSHPDYTGTYEAIGTLQDVVEIPTDILSEILASGSTKKKRDWNKEAEILNGSRDSWILAWVGKWVSEGKDFENVLALSLLKNEEKCKNEDGTLSDPLPKEKILQHVNFVFNKEAQKESTPPREQKPSDEDIMETIPPPWPGDVSPSEVFDLIYNQIKRFVYAPEEVRYAATLYVMATYRCHRYKAFGFFNITAAFAESGKSRLAEIMFLCSKWGLDCNRITSALLAREVDGKEDFLVWMDESTRAFQNDPQLEQVMLGGYKRRTSKVRICETVGKTIKPKRMITYGPRIFSGNGNLPEELVSRSITCQMYTMPKSFVDQYDEEDEEDTFWEIRRKAVAALNMPRKRFPAAELDKLNIHQRNKEKWKPLYEICLILGGNHVDRMVKSFNYLNKHTAEKTSNGFSKRLLYLIKELVETPRFAGKAYIPFNELYTTIYNHESRMWEEDDNGKKFSTGTLSRTLRSLKVDTIQTRAGSDTGKQITCYLRSDLERLFQSYFQETPPDDPTPKKPTSSPPEEKDEQIQDFSQNSSGDGPVAVNFGHHHPIDTAIQNHIPEGTKMVPKNKKKELGEVAPIEYHLFKNFEEMKETLDQHKIWALDIETYATNPDAPGGGLNPHVSDIRLLQFYNGSGAVYIMDTKRFPLTLTIRNFLTKFLFISHNASFEYQFMVHGCPSKWNFHCTMLMYQALYSRTPSLKELALKEFNIELDKSYQLEDWSNPNLTDNHYRYAAFDAKICWDLYQKYMPLIEQQGLQELYSILKDTIPAAAEINLSGVRLDVQAHEIFITQNETRLKEFEEKMMAAIPIENPNSHTQKAAWLDKQLTPENKDLWPRTAKGKLKTGNKDFTANAELLGLGSEFVSMNREFALVSKRVSSFGREWAKHVNPVTGRIHSSFKIAGADTGRFTSRDPNLQQVPRDKEYRNLFIPAEGNRFVHCDYQALEFRAAAALAGAHDLIEMINKGADVHMHTATYIYGKQASEITKQERYIAKTCNFGLVYGAGAKKLRFILKQSGIEISEEEAQQLKDKWHYLYPSFKQWNYKNKDQAEACGYATNTFGARKYLNLEVNPATNKPFDNAFTKASNTLVQGSCAYGMLIALSHIKNEISDHKYESKIILVVHDEVIVESPLQEADAIKDIVQTCMVEGMAEAIPGIPTHQLAEPKIIKNWGDK